MPRFPLPYTFVPALIFFYSFNSLVFCQSIFLPQYGIKLNIADGVAVSDDRPWSNVQRELRSKRKAQKLKSCTLWQYDSLETGQTQIKKVGHYEYDNNGYIIIKCTISSFDSACCEYTYGIESNGNLREEIRRCSGKYPYVGTSNYMYDASNNMIEEIIYSVHDTVKKLESRTVRTYDEKGNYSAVHFSSNGKIERRGQTIYDSLGRLTKTIQFGADSLLISESHWKYDNIGRLIESGSFDFIQRGHSNDSSIFVSSYSSDGLLEVSYGYDGILSTIITDSVFYDKNGNLIREFSQHINRENSLYDTTYHKAVATYEHKKLTNILTTLFESSGRIISERSLSFDQSGKTTESAEKEWLPDGKLKLNRLVYEYNYFD